VLETKWIAWVFIGALGIAPGCERSDEDVPYEDEVDLAPPRKPLPDPAKGCQSDDDCAFTNYCLGEGCGLKTKHETGRRKCEEGYMGPRRTCVCRDTACTFEVSGEAPSAEVDAKPGLPQ
jgi:hypothetical protein